MAYTVERIILTEQQCVSCSTAESLSLSELQPSGVFINTAVRDIMSGGGRTIVSAVATSLAAAPVPATTLKNKLLPANSLAPTTGALNVMVEVAVATTAAGVCELMVMLLGAVHVNTSVVLALSAAVTDAPTLPALEQ
eukprot:18977-Heterococcus_DN1.PRE.2